ncbi:MAG: hypothetical protein WCS90_03705 [Bacilli bacterium]
MTPLFTPLDEAGRPHKDAAAVIALDGAGTLCTFKGKNLCKIPFESVSDAISIPSGIEEGIGEFVASPEGLNLSFVVAYSFQILFPSILIARLREDGYEGEILANLSVESFFKEVLSPLFAKAMAVSFADEVSLNFSILQAKMKRGSFNSDYLKALNTLAIFPLGVDFSSLRFGAAERSSLRNGIARKKEPRIAQKAGH